MWRGGRKKSCLLDRKYNHLVIDGSNFNPWSYASAFYDRGLTIGHYKYLCLSLPRCLFFSMLFSLATFVLILLKLVAANVPCVLFEESYFPVNRSWRAIFTLQEQSITTNKNSYGSLLLFQSKKQHTNSKKTERRKLQEQSGWKNTLPEGIKVFSPPLLLRLLRLPPPLLHLPPPPLPLTILLLSSSLLRGYS